ncbi:MAG: glutathione S-transferase family protein [Caulobacteraceae bacterium]|nr:glutathione S-transferase family protein [Caulobacteraceae bacterium]
MTGLILYTNPMSRGRVARWMLEEVGVPYEAVIVAFGRNRAPDYLALNPMGKLPTLTHGKTVVTEAAAICAYLADAFPQAGLAPPPAERGAYYRWLFFAAGPVEAATTNKSFGFQLPEGGGRMAGYGSYEATLDALEYAVSQTDYIAGDRFTAADVYVGSQIGFGLQFGSMEKRPAFERYWARLGDRPACVKAKAIDDALMPARPAS